MTVPVPVPVLEDRVLLQPGDLQPLAPGHTVVGTFNPAATRIGDQIALLVRVTEWPRTPDGGGHVAPRVVWSDGDPEWVTDTFEAATIDTGDPRTFELPDGRTRLPHISHLRLAMLDAGGSRVTRVISPPGLIPREPWEELGIEDPRITRIGDTYYITYVAISRNMGVATALMTTVDFQTFERHGIIFPTENKDVVLLPETWEDRFLAFHRPASHTQIGAPSIVTSESPDAIHWGRHRFLAGPRPGRWDSVKIGAGPPPIRLPQGWLLLYHGVDDPTPTNPIGCYRVGAILLDSSDPTRVVARSAEPLLRPERPYEIDGFIPNVIFPTGALLSRDGDDLLIFSGCADQVVSMIRIPVAAVLSHLGVG